MKILIINSEYPPIGGGAGNASANIARQLVALGHSVLVLTARFGDLPASEICEGVTIQRVPALRRRQDRSNALEQLVFIASASFWSLGWSRQNRPNATLAFFGMPSGAVAWLLKAIYKIPYIVSLRGGDVPGFRPYDFKFFHKLIGPCLHFIWHKASAVIANSQGLYDLAHAFDASIEIPIISNGVDGTRYTNEARAWSPPRLFSVGRIVYQKGLDLGLRALAQLKDLDWLWSIAGDGPQMETLKSLARELGIAERVTFLGWQSREQLAMDYHQANLFLFPSRHEGMPNAMLEAMSSGLPVVATKIAGNEELVIEGETGFLIPSENVDALRDALRKILTDPSLREKMGAASRQRVEQEYSWENVARQYSEFLEKIS
jgi:glycosyltransferase involved in cell wall biosynthesis